MWSRRRSLVSLQLLLLGLAAAATAASSEEPAASPSTGDVASALLQSLGEGEALKERGEVPGETDPPSLTAEEGLASNAASNSSSAAQTGVAENALFATASREASNSAEALAAGHASAEADSEGKVPRLVRRPYSEKTGGFLKTPQSFMQRKFDAEGNPIPLTEEQLEAEIDRLFEMAPEEVDQQTAAIARSVDASRSAQNPIGRIIIAIAGEDEGAQRSQADRNAISSSVKAALQEEQLQSLNLIEDVKVLPELGLAVMNFSPDTTEEQIRETVKTVWAKTPEAWLIEADSIVEMRAGEGRLPFASPSASASGTSSPPSEASTPRLSREPQSPARRERRERSRERPAARVVGQQASAEASSEARGVARQQRREALEERRAERQQRQRQRTSRVEALSLDGAAAAPPAEEGSSQAPSPAAFGSGYLSQLQKQVHLLEHQHQGEQLFAQLKLQAQAANGASSQNKTLRGSDGLEGAEEQPLASEKPRVASYEQMTAGLRRLAAAETGADAQPTAEEREEKGEEEDDVEEGVDEEGRAWRIAFFSENAQQPNDALFAQQWALKDPTYGCKATEAWRLVYSRGNLQRGSPEARMQARMAALKQEVLVAVIDTGIDYRHPDLQRSLWKNHAEIPDNGIDDDGNGYVDDFHGYDFEAGMPDPSDRHGHGTHVAGILAASANNRIGVAGINWRVKMMPLKFERRASAACEAISYSLQMGARLSTNSWGFTSESEALKLAIEKAEKAGQLFVAAVDNAGRNNANNGDFPPNWGLDVRSGKGLSNILRVANLARTGRLAVTSNFGAFNVDLAAPGTDILSTVPTRGRDIYGYKSGTSMATPLVAGVAAMVWATRPSLSAAEVRHLLMYSSSPLPELREKVLSGGIVDAEAAVRLAMALNKRDEGVESPEAEAFEAFLRKGPAAQHAELQRKAQQVDAADDEASASAPAFAVVVDDNSEETPSPPAVQPPAPETASTTTPPQQGPGATGAAGASPPKQPRLPPGIPSVIVVPPRPKTGGGEDSGASGSGGSETSLFKLPTPSVDEGVEAASLAPSAGTLPGGALLTLLDVLKPLGLFDLLGL